ncbi:DUF397 domain-containing protein [Actinocorallia sp. API 0066]|uniref:DUF397 domain-containing protein n=1 Tax=Actinocorallia sp. API 0066 TaxID=2896846 RepID=UPI001E39AEDB|nr:DUF397 domain-containing protein [Actinocorallia sp. API 0066]MCD0453135.1 DUF397 domain-containing protein [Actinocorallia sp. API 0066]
MSTDFTAATWRKSTRSNADQECVELAKSGRTVGVRDSKTPERGHLELAPSSFGQFLTHVKTKANPLEL